MRHFDLNPQQSGDGAHQALGLPQWLLEHHAKGQAKLNRQVRIDSLAARRRSWCRRPQSVSLFTYPNGQIAAQTQAFAYAAQLVTRRFCFGILSRRSALNLCGIYSILKKADRHQYQWSGGPCNNATQTPDSVIDRFHPLKNRHNG